MYKGITDFGTSPDWLSDSRRLVFSDGSKLFVVDRQSKKVHEVLSVSPDEPFSPKLAPDGRSRYFSRERIEADIWLATMK